MINRDSRENNRTVDMIDCICGKGGHPLNSTVCPVHGIEAIAGRLRKYIYESKDSCLRDGACTSDPCPCAQRLAMIALGVDGCPWCDEGLAVTLGFHVLAPGREVKCVNAEGLKIP
jgi:hypothetical protein